MLQLVPGKTRPNLIDPAQRRVIPDLDFARAERVIVLQESRKFTFNRGPMLTLDQRHESLSDDSRIGVFAQIREKTIRLAPCGQNPPSLGPNAVSLAPIDGCCAQRPPYRTGCNPRVPDESQKSFQPSLARRGSQQPLEGLCRILPESVSLEILERSLLVHAKDREHHQQ